MGISQGKLNLASEQIDEGRQGSAVLNALNFAKNTPKFAITWTNAGSPKPNGGIDSYDHGVSFKFADPSLLTLTAELTPSAGAGSSITGHPFPPIPQPFCLIWKLSKEVQIYLMVPCMPAGNLRGNVW